MSPDPALPTPRGAALTVGTFDGVHRGHRLVAERLAAAAAARDLAAVLVTFDRHPLAVVNPAAAPPLLTTPEEQLEALAELPVDYVCVLPFTAALAAYDAAAFVRHVLRDRLQLRHLLLGHDHGFGRGRAGNETVLQALGVELGYSVEVVEPVQADDGPAISSSAIRRAVAGGDLARAARGLGRHYAVAGHVVPGEARGRTLGFRTLNVAWPQVPKLLPPEGVYAVRVLTARGAFGGMVNLGPRPTFGESAARLEAHLFDVEGDFYGQRVRVDFVDRLREVRQFADAAALRDQLQRDEAAARARLAERG